MKFKIITAIIVIVVLTFLYLITSAPKEVTDGTDGTTTSEVQ